MKAKLLLQTFSRKKLSWDDPLEEANNGQWKRWLDDLPKLHDIQVDPRDLVMLKKYSCTSSRTLPGKEGYAAVTYLRLKDVTNQVHCVHVFVMGKTRLAPVC